MNNNFELVEKMVNTFGVSYETAKKALEATNWDPVEAAVLIEKEKNGAKNENQAAESWAKFEEKASKETRSAVNSVKDFLTKNTVLIKKSSGETFLDMPIWLAAILLCAFFWAVLGILVILLFMGYQVTLSGPLFGKVDVKCTVEKEAEPKEDIVEEVKYSAAETVESVLENTDEIKSEQKDDPQA